MAAVGFDLYTRLLAEAVEEQKAVLEHGEPVRPRAQTVIDLPDRRLPARRLRRRGAAEAGAVPAAGQDGDGLARSTTIRAEMVDRFGPLPAPVERLLEVARLRIAAEAAGIASLAREGNELIVRFQRRLVALGHDARDGANIADRSPARRAPPAASLRLEPDPRARRRKDAGGGVADDARRSWSASPRAGAHGRLTPRSQRVC